MAWRATSLSVSSDQANAWLHEHPETQVLDVRSAGEYSEGALPKAINVSIGDAAFDSKVGALDKAKPVLVYCAGGFRSRAQAYQRLIEAADYLLRTEPHSPTPYLVKRAVAWGSMSLTDLLSEIVNSPGDLQAIFSLLGIRGRQDRGDRGE